MPLKLTILQFLVPGLVTLVALAAESPTPSPRLSYGMELLRQGRVDEAIEVLNAENKAHPNNPILLNTFGAAFCLKNRPGDAGDVGLACRAGEQSVVPDAMEAV